MTCRGSSPRTGSTIKKLRRELHPIFHDRLVFLSFSAGRLIIGEVYRESVLSVGTSAVADSPSRVR